MRWTGRPPHSPPSPPPDPSTIDSIRPSPNHRRNRFTHDESDGYRDRGGDDIKAKTTTKISGVSAGVTGGGEQRRYDRGGGRYIRGRALTLSEGRALPEGGSVGVRGRGDRCGRGERRRYGRGGTGARAITRRRVESGLRLLAYVAFPREPVGNCVNGDNYETVAPMAITVQIWITLPELIPSGELHNNLRSLSWDSEL